MAKILLFTFVLAGFLYGAETSISRYARSEQGVLSREYDMEGGRAYWINGISILGLPDAGASLVGFSEPARRLPLGFSGIYSPVPIYEPYGLSLNASNGNLIFKENYNPIDTPITAILWERYGLAGNVFRLEFNRLLLDSVAFSLGIATHSVSKSDNFIYSDVVHQFFVGSLKRDSSKVPFAGRNLYYNSIHLAPAITWIFPHSSLTAQMNQLFLDNDDATRHFFTKEGSGIFVNFPQSPYHIKGNSGFYGLIWNYNFLPGYNLNISHRFASQELNFSKPDTTESYHGQSGEAEVSHKSFLNPTVKVKYEYMWGEENLYQDRQLVLLGIKDTLWRFAFRGESGLQRNAFALDSVGTDDFAQALFLGLTIFLPHHLTWNTYWQQDTRFPDFMETHIKRVGRIAFPNEELKAEKRQKFEMNLEYKLSEHFFYTAGYKHEKALNAIKPYWALQKVDSLETLPADTAFKWANAPQSLWNHELFWRLGFELGNWCFFAERGKKILRASVIDVPARYYKGAVYWSNRFVQERLKVNVQFDADWFGSRWDYGLERDNNAAPINLRNYLWLNFKTSMQIQSFTIYSRIENMNHSLMEPEAGYTPPGIRFAYGIEWTLDD
ncbi:MAG: hypothetical protein FWF63_05905 [Fibromonadales bacterium]|nr:hypothetical protein [Fibromonadales bacterium]